MAKTKAKEESGVQKIADVLARVEYWEGEIRRANSSGSAHINLNPRIPTEDRHIKAAERMLA